MKRKTGIAITGIGTANPLGTSFAETSCNLFAARSGVRPMQRFDPKYLSSKLAGQVAEIPMPQGQDAAAFAKLERMDQLLLWCAVEALQEAGWWERRSGIRLGIVLGNGGEWLRLWEADRLAGGNRVHDPAQDAETSVQALRRNLGITGPALTVAAACASGNYALAEARRWLNLGWVDVCLAGAADLTVCPLGMAAFGNLRALSRRNEAPEKASRPFDEDRDGFVMSEGGALFVLERGDEARQRGAKSYGEIIGFGASSDAFHLVIPSSDPAPAAAAMKQALADAAVTPEQVDYINAHATSTPIGDPGEARAVKMVLGESVGRVPISSTKGMTGHVLCAAAAVEAMACLAAFREQAVPPTINLDTIDPECADLCHVPHQARPHKVEIALSNSFGFGGSNTCLVLRKPA
ncbi:MAG: beta-ketoacyl-[acyl-carrier-protein] synthase family protein [Gemmataceae bacterium]